MCRLNNRKFPIESSFPAFTPGRRERAENEVTVRESALVKGRHAVEGWLRRGVGAVWLVDEGWEGATRDGREYKGRGRERVEGSRKKGWMLEGGGWKGRIAEPGRHDDAFNN